MEILESCLRASTGDSHYSLLFGESKLDALFRHIKADTRASDIASIISSVIAVVSGAVREDRTTLDTVSIVASTSTLFTHLGNMFTTFNKVYSIQEFARTLFSDNMNSIEDHWAALTANPSRIVTSLLRALVFGFTLAGFDMDFNRIAKSITSTKIIFSSIDDAEKFVMESILGIPLQKDLTMMTQINNRIIDSQHFITMDKRLLFSDAKISGKLLKQIGDNQKFLLSLGQVDKTDIGPIFLGLKNQLVSCQARLQDKYNLFCDAAKLRIRQEPVAVLYRGVRGLGKTRFSKFISHKIAKHYGWSSELYSMVADPYFEPYSGCELGFYEDIFNNREPDTFVKSLTQIIGTNHFNMPGASLETKHQPCNIKFLGLTTNVSSLKDLKKHIHDEGVSAIASRFLTIDVEDPLLSGDPRYTRQAHQTPTYEHLHLYRTMMPTGTVTPGEQPGARERITIDDLVALIIEQIDLRVTTFLEEQAALEANMNTINAADDHLYVRISGKIHIGKSRLAANIRDHIERTYRGRKQREINIFIADDPDSTDDRLMRYFEQVQSLPPRSVVILTSNRKPTRPGLVERLKRAITLRPTNYQKINLPCEGLYRRVGLAGLVELPNGTLYNNSAATNIHVVGHSPTSWTIEDTQFNLREIHNHITKGILQYISRGIDIITSNEIPPPLSDPDFTITSPSFDTVRADLSKLASILKTKAGFRPTKFRFSPAFETFMASNLTIDDFIVGNVTDHHEVMITLLRNVYQARQSFTANIVIGDRTFVFDSGVLYAPEDDDRWYFSLQETSRTIKCVHSQEGTEQEVYTVPYEEAIRFEFDGTPPPSLPFDGHVAFLSWTRDELSRPHAEFNLAMLDFAAKHGTVSLSYVSYIKSIFEAHPLLTSFALVAVGVSVTGVIAYGLTRFFTKNDDEDDDMNTATAKSQRQLEMRKLNQARRAITRKQRDLDPGYSKQQHEEWYRLEDALGRLGDNSNHFSLAQLEHIEDVLHVSKCTKAIPLLRESVVLSTTNMLRNTPTLDPRTTIDPLYDILEKAYYQITTSSGSAHALILKGNIGVTVDHLFYKETTGIISDDNGVHNIKVFFRSKERDFALFHVLTPGFLAPNIMKHLARKDEIINASAGYYLRLGTRSLIATGVYRYSAKYALHDTQHPEWSPDTDIISFTASCIADSGLVYGIGDCGFPLLIKNRSQQPKIVGIHIAFSNTFQLGRFATIDYENMMALLADSQNSSAHIAAINALIGPIGPPLVTNAPINIIGSVPNHYDPPMKPKSILFPGIDNIKLENQNDCDFAPVNNRDHTPAMKATFPKRDDGTPDVLLKQAYKFKTETGAKPDPKILRQAFDFVEVAWRQRYGMNKILSTTEVLNHIKQPELWAHSKPVERGTSPGFTYKQLFQLNDKKNFIVDRGEPGKGRPYYQIDPLHPAGKYLLNRMKHIWNLALTGAHEPLIVMDCKKVELLPKEKVEQGNVRLFNVLDLDYNILQARLFGHDIAVQMRNRGKGFSQIGINAHSEFHLLNEHMNEIEGKRLPTDFSRFDKSHRKYMSDEFHAATGRRTISDTLTREEITNLYKAMGDAYMDRIHFCGPHVYLLDEGHPSGSRITGHFNNYCVEVSTVYCLLRHFYQKHPNDTITQQELYHQIRLICYGDDRDLRRGGVFAEMTFEEEREYMKELNYTLTLAEKDFSLGSGSFISRAFLEKDGLVYAPLKKSSINRHLYFLPSLRPHDIVAVWERGLIEAAAWDREYYESYMRDVLRLADTLPCKDKVLKDLIRFTYDEVDADYREHIRFSVRFGRFPSDQTQDSKDTSRIKQILNDLDSYTRAVIKQNPDYYNTLNSSDTMNSLPTPTQETPTTSDCTSDSISCVIIYLQKLGAAERPQDHYNQEGGFWYCNSSLQFDKTYGDLIPKGTIYCGTGRSTGKKEAKHIAYQRILDQLPAQHQLPVKIREHANTLRTILHDAGYTFDEEAYDEVTSIVQTLDVTIYYMRRLATQPDSMNSAPVDPMSQQALTPSSNVLAPQGSSTVSGGDRMATIPSGVAPQPVAAPPIVPVPMSVTASTAAPESTFMSLNPLGPTNMLGVGAIDFDLKDLVYKQFMATEVQYTFTDDQALGQIILSIPYGAESPYLNPYIKRWSELHGRYAGPYFYNFRMVGNPTFSGEVIIGWLPRKPIGTSIDAAELMKYSWVTLNCNGTQSGTIALKDARKNFFYREYNSPEESLTERPHLVMASYISLQSPLREGIQVRMRINSCLSDGGTPDCEPTMYAEPILAPTAALVAGSCSPEPQTLASYRPYTDKLYMVTDGRRQPSWRVSNANGFIENRRMMLEQDTDHTRLNGVTTGLLAPNFAVGYNEGELTHAIVCVDEMPFANRSQISWPATLALAQTALVDGFNGLGTLTSTTSESVDLDQPSMITPGPGPRTLVSIHYHDYNGRRVRFYYFTVPQFLSNDQNVIQWNSHSPILHPNFRDLIGPIQDKEFLPSGWARLSFTLDEPCIVSDAVAATSIDTVYEDLTLNRIFMDRACDLQADASSSLQFDLIDPESGRVVTTVRYSILRRCFMVSTNDTYAQYPSEVGRLLLSNMSVVANANELRPTPTSDWLDRTEGSGFAQLRALDYKMKLKDSNTINFWGAIAGGALGGVGNAIGSHYERKHQKDMQQELFQHNMQMQQGMFTHQNFDREDRQIHDKEMTRQNHNNRLALRVGTSPARMGSNPSRTIRLAQAADATALRESSV